MGKPTIIETSSYEYSSGRVDNLVIQKENGVHKAIVGLLSYLEFSENVLDDFDLEMDSFEGYLFGYSKDIKIHLFASDENIYLVFDSKEDKSSFVKKIEKFFLFLS